MLCSIYYSFKLRFKRNINCNRFIYSEMGVELYGKRSKLFYECYFRAIYNHRSRPNLDFICNHIICLSNSDQVWACLFLYEASSNISDDNMSARVYSTSTVGHKPNRLSLAKVCVQTHIPWLLLLEPDTWKLLFHLGRNNMP